MPEESLETKVAVLGTKVDYLNQRMDKSLVWARWIGTSVGGYLLLQILETFKFLPNIGVTH